MLYCEHMVLLLDLREPICIWALSMHYECQTVCGMPLTFILLKIVHIMMAGKGTWKYLQHAALRVYWSFPCTDSQSAGSPASSAMKGKNV